LSSVELVTVESVYGRQYPKIRLVFNLLVLIMHARGTAWSKSPSTAMKKKTESSIWGSMKKRVIPTRKKQINSGDPSSSCSIDSTPSTSAIPPDVGADQGEAKSSLTSSKSLSNAPENNATGLTPQPGASIIGQEAGVITAESLLMRSPEDIENTGGGTAMTLLIDG